MSFYKRNIDDKNQIFEEIRTNHEAWKNELNEMNKPFFMIPTDFKHLFLKDISGGALKLYLFLGFQSKYRSGESWYTNEEIGKFFCKDPRTVTKWFKELEDIGLVFRAQKGVMMRANTFLLPYGFSINPKDYHFDATEEDIENDIFVCKKENLVVEQAIILNNGLQETSLILLYQKEKCFKVSCFFDYQYQDIKLLRAFFKQKSIPVDNFEIDISLAYSKYSPQAIYKNIMQYFDEEGIW